MALALTRSSIAQCLPSTLTRRLYVRLLLGEFRFFVFVISVPDRKNIILIANVFLFDNTEREGLENV